MSHNTLSQTIKGDHQEIFEYHNQYKSAFYKGDIDAQTRWANQLRWEIARHAVGEEIIVYPLMQEHLGEKGQQMAEHDRKDHQIVKQDLYKLESLRVGTTEFDALFTDMMVTLHRHIEDEESQDLPALEEALGEAASQDAAKSFQRTTRFMPTRSHPSAPDTPPFETIAGLLTAPMDKLKDVFASFPKEEEVTAAKAELRLRGL